MTAVKRAAIDIGSNSIRLALPDGTVRSEITKLADGLESTGALSQAGAARTLDVLRRYTGECRELGIQSVVAFATEAVRRAADGEKFCAEVKRATGIDIIILSGEDEARLALAGAVKPEGEASVCDLGGGSMELVCAADGKTPEYIKSLPLGVVVLKNRYNGDFRAAIDEAPALVAGYGAPPRYPLTVIGGSVCTIAAGIQNLAVYDKTKIDGYTVTARALDGMLPMFMSKDLPVLRPVCAKRADTLPYGAIILRALMTHLGLDSFSVSDSGNLTAVMNGAL